MAPKVAQTNGQNHGMRKAVVPAIPLVYLQKLKQQLPVREKAKAETKDEAAVAAVVSQPSPLSLSTPTPSPPPVKAPHQEVTPAVVNGSTGDHASAKTKQTMEHPQLAASATPVGEKEAHIVADTAREASIHGITTEEKHQSEIPEPSEPPSSASRSTFHMPPPFVPARHSQPNIKKDSHMYVPPKIQEEQHQLHHAHPNGGSQVFGGYPDSNNSSPAPPVSAGNAPPYPYHPQSYIGHHGAHASNGSYTQYMANDQSAMGPPAPPGFYPRQDNFINQGPEGYTRRPFPPGFTDGYSPSLTPPTFDTHRPAVYDPLTPQSFHGSQASVPNEQDPASTNQFSNATASNGANGYGDENRAYSQATRLPPATGSHVQPPTHITYSVVPNLEPDNYDGLVYYLRKHFADPEYADWNLELRYSDDHARPVRIPGHSLIFARSRKLKALMETQMKSNIGKSLLIESSDRFLRSDGFNMAIERLYGGRLMSARDDYEPNTGRSYFSSSELSAKRFDTALGYAVAGHVLDLNVVRNRGVEVAAEFISWQTIEKAIDFSIDGGLQSHWVDPGEARSPPTYGPSVETILFLALDFITASFPANFQLDRSAAEPTYNRRLPTTTQDRVATHNPRLSSLKFGDHPGDHNIQSQANDYVSAILSRILLNLPFQLLKYALESGRLGANEGWAGQNTATTIRDNAMGAIIAERESRRLKALASIPSLTGLSSIFYEALHMQEETISRDGGLELTRKLVIG